MFDLLNKDDYTIKVTVRNSNGNRLHYKNGVYYTAPHDAFAIYAFNDSDYTFMYRLTIDHTLDQVVPLRLGPRRGVQVYKIIKDGVEHTLSLPFKNNDYSQMDEMHFTLYFNKLLPKFVEDENTYPYTVTDTVGPDDVEYIKIIRASESQESGQTPVISKISFIVRMTDDQY